MHLPEAVADDGDDVGRVELHVVGKRKWIAGSVRQKVNWKEIVEKCKVKPKKLYPLKFQENKLMYGRCIIVLPKIIKHFSMRS